MRIIRMMFLALCATAFPGTAFSQAPQSKFAEANGIRIHYLVAGKGDPIVLLHGFAQTSHMWRPLIKELAKTHTVIAPDLRGYGSTAAPADGYTKTMMAQDIHALLGKLGHKSIGLVGHDIGLMVAYAYAAQYPAEVKRIVLRPCGGGDADVQGVRAGCQGFRGIREDAAHDGVLIQAERVRCNACSACCSTDFTATGLISEARAASRIG